MTMPRFTRLHALGLGVIIGILFGLAIYDAFASPTVVEREVTKWKTNTVTKIEEKEVRVPEAHTVVKWRDRIVRAQIDTTNGRRDTVLVSEEFAARFEGADSSNGGTVQGWIRSHPLRVEDILVECPPDTSIATIDSVMIDRTITERPWLGIGVGPYAGVDHTGQIRYGVAVWAGLIIGSW